VSPSIKFKIREFIFKDHLFNFKHFNGNEEFIQDLLNVVSFKFSTPEEKILKEMDSEGKDVFFNVVGLLNAFKQITTTRRIKLGQLMPGQIIGYEQAILGSNHRVTYETVSYSTLGQIRQKEFNKVLFRFGSLRKNIIECAANNKFDILKDRFIEVARKSIPYF